MSNTVRDQAFGKPGMPPGWTHSNKTGVGTAYSASSHLWFTMWKGIVTEVSFPTVDLPQMRDLQYLVTDGKTFFHEEKRDLNCTIERISEHALGYRCTNTDPECRYAIVKEVITNPHLACLLQRTELKGVDPAFLADLKLYALCAPHLEVGGYGNNGSVITANGQRILLAQKGATWMAMGATLPFSKASCGYVGASDGWTDLSENFAMDWEFHYASDGNIALTGEMDLSRTKQFTLGVAFGNNQHHAVANLLQSLAVPFDEHLSRYKKQWDIAASSMRALSDQSFDGGNLYNSSYSLLLAHEDKAYAGALIASLTIPWGESKGDDDRGGYHLVWTRDMVSSVTALLAAGDTTTPLRALIFLAVSQHEDGGFAQNFWVDGQAYWSGTQLDEVAFPIMLAWQLMRHDALDDFDPSYLIRKATEFLIRNGPVTQQERWEEASGYSPSTLASNIVALTCAAAHFSTIGDDGTAHFVQSYADYLEAHIEAWTATGEGTLVEGIAAHYIRILPEEVGQLNPAEDKEERILRIANRAPNDQADFPAKNVVDGGFLELVRYGIRSAHDPLILNTIRVVDAILKVETPAGPAWHRYNHDGYGQQRDGGPFTQYGVGRVWPLLTGERGHYELAAGNSPDSYIRTMEALASATGLLPEQSWDAENLPEKYMHFGKPTGSAMPLMWAHAEYMKLLRSTADGRIFDQIPEVTNRYLHAKSERKTYEVWKILRPVRYMRAGETLRVIADAAFRLHWTNDGWATAQDTDSAVNALNIPYVDLDDFDTTPGARIDFTFLWTESQRWEGRNYDITVL